MIRRGRWLALLLLSGCASEGPIEPVRRLDSPEQALQQASAEAEAGRWSRVLDILAQAAREFPDDAQLAQQRARLSEHWQRERQRIEDQLALVRGTALLEELTLLEPLAVAEPDRRLLGVQLGQRRRDLRGLRAELLSCAERQLALSLDLARRCAELADRIERDQRSLALTQAVDAQTGAQVARAEAREVRTAESRRDRLLGLAERRLTAGDYAGAIQPVEEILAEDPGNARALALRATLTRAIERQIGALNVLAARLYADGEIDAAIRVWDSSLKVAPAQPEIVERVERARRVQGNLQQLRAAPAPQGDATGSP